MKSLTTDGSSLLRRLAVIGRQSLTAASLLLLASAAPALAADAKPELVHPAAAGDEPVAPGPQTPIHWKKTTLSTTFYCEGANFGDFNHDGKMDVVSGPYWYEGPDFSSDKRHEIYAPKEYKADGAYSENFLTFVADFNGDGWDDVLVVGFPGKEAFWFENPKGADRPWEKHEAFHVVDNESPGFGDFLRNGKPVLICMSGGQIGYAQPDPANPTALWSWHPACEKTKDYQKFTHGIGWGDVNGDGRNDLLVAKGWYEQPADINSTAPWAFHAADFGNGGAQMYVYDVNGDGKPDVITSIQAHGYGLAWFEQKDDGKFEKHLIVGAKAAESPYAVHFSQPHALFMADVDGDGLPDLITGKRHFAHHSHGDVEPLAPSVLYWFQLVRKDGKAEFVPHLIDDASGVGTQVVAGDLNGAKRPAVIVGNKNGTFVFQQEPSK